MKKLLLFSICLVLFFGCVYKKIPYHPEETNVYDAKSTIARVLSSQKALNYAVTSEWFRVVVRSTWDTNSRQIHVNYHDIGETKIFHKKNYYCVTIYSKGGIALYWVYLYNEEEAKRFVDSVYFMTDANLKNTISEDEIITKTAGTGFAVAPDGFIHTAYHVIEGAKTIIVTLSDGRTTNANVWLYSATHDLAVLRLDTPTPNYLSLLSTNEIKVGARVFTMGFPIEQYLGKEPKYTNGSISSLSGPGEEPTFFQISIPIQPGNSGGPVVTEEGQVVGVITASAAIIPFISATGTLPQNLNWAIKSDYAIPLFETPPAMEKAVSLEEAIDRVTKAVCIIKVGF